MMRPLGVVGVLGRRGWAGGRRCERRLWAVCGAARHGDVPSQPARFYPIGRWRGMTTNPGTPTCRGPGRAHLQVLQKAEDCSGSRGGSPRGWAAPGASNTNSAAAVVVVVARNDKETSHTSLFRCQFKARQDEINVGGEMAGPLKREDILRVLNRFYTNETVKELARENGLDSTQKQGLNRKIIFHAGPTNSGKTYHAMERFLTAESGIYCGPLSCWPTRSSTKATPEAPLVTW
ncbi:ATP-dependent RNA helicase SUV3, mitochondrial [Chionoecetes opilio]|uniref:ATP-dependent RNA helicase SUV3, mitochondrial n=1 Tax=Chionoecetes opilio TaxID=41210 RepID=A0A8J5D092_CHIOP|nr:ATP-dependent RNA helicase SUV3, mitochondrial [Chionoecetes opilio]